MVKSIALLQLLHHLKSPRWLILLSIYCFVIAVFSNQFSFQFIKLQAANTSNLSLSSTLFTPLDNLAVFLLLVVMPIIILQFRASRIASGLQRLLSSYPISTFKLWLTDWLVMLVLLLCFLSVLFVLHLPIILSATLDLPLYLTHWLALFLMSLSFMTLFLFLQQVTSSLLGSLIAHYSVLFLFWGLQLLQQWPDYFYLLQAINLFAWFDRLSLGILNAQDILAFTITNLSLVLLCFFHSQRRIISLLLTTVLLFLLLIIIRTLPTQYIDNTYIDNTYIDTTSDNRYSLQPLLIEQLNQAERIKISSYGLDELALREVKLRLLHPVVSRFPDTRVVHMPLDRQASEQGKTQNRRGILFTIEPKLNNTAASDEPPSVTPQTVWLDYPFVEHPQHYLLRSLTVLQHRQNNWILFARGHNEASIAEQGQRHLSSLANALETRGFQLSQLALNDVDSIPANTSLLVIASSRQNWLPKANRLLMDYLQTGGRLLWLRDPEDAAFPELETYLGVTKLDGVIIDPAGYQQGTPHPAVVLHNKFTQHPISHSLKSLVALPWSSALVPLNNTSTQWQRETVLSTHPNTWTELAPKQENMAFNEQQGELQGQFATMIALQRTQGIQQQKVVIAGDSHFLSDMAINNYDNQQLALNIFYWLTQTSVDTIPTLVEPTDRYLQLTPLAHHLLSWFLPFTLPLLLFLSGVFLWRKQKR